MCGNHIKYGLFGSKERIGTGWLPPYPDFRDYSKDHPEILGMAKKLGFTPQMDKDLKKLEARQFKTGKFSFFIPNKVDLRKYCSPIEDQGALGSCTAQAAAGVVEYFQRRAFKKHINASRLFIYKTTRNLMGVTGDTGAWIRNTMGALVLCGCPPEKYWQYTDAPDEFDEEPSSFVYSLADNYEAVKYFCHDPIGSYRSTNTILLSVKLYLLMGIPSMFGFWGYEHGYWDNGTYIPPYNNGEVLYPCQGDYSLWGHAVVAVGYDNNKKIVNPRCNKKTVGALLIRNSWGTDWGDKGYGWIPYDFIHAGIALDFWSLLNMEWIDTKKFGI